MERTLIQKIDKSGKITIPDNLMKELSWNTNSQIILIKNNKSLTLKQYEINCAICGNNNSLEPVKDKFICQSCIDAIFED